ncbi:hypothetical protein D8674_014959 [Pyrus ussuriensis x Pyrus communis]|uniref:Histone acetyltransferase n=1 Tax=Pyrus ussuriensis x Pyrus communis TaxID=2448454 RepID=A0A5N5H141_9ROSA|nr:hypothetical protein D8674_014959 [Pyrus ussuriensis x Pyrus communis]
MPRSGPRPYECVRRAWHRERHQPMRGSLIKEIFRVVNGIHSSATKKNKEWQEKLPIVVLKAEEIMYSKANSEAEYMDLKTLWDRTNDAINTIIRRDETTETGEFLQPCIEAALILGCIPRRATRSQRNTNPRCYLMPVTSHVPSISPSVVEDANKKDYTSNSQYRPHCSNFVNPKTTNSTPLVFEPRCPVAQYNDCNTMKFMVASENVPPLGYDQCFSRENLATFNFPKYPLYYGNLPQFREPKPGFAVLPKPVSDPLEPAKIGVIPNLLCNGDKSNNNTQTERMDYHENPCLIGCDLSLRLGPHSSQLPSGESSQPQGGKDVGVEERLKCRDQSPQFDKQFSLTPKGSEYGPTDSWGRLSFEGEDLYVQAAMRKRKAAFNHPTEDSKFCRQPELPFSHFNGSMRNGGL